MTGPVDQAQIGVVPYMTPDRVATIKQLKIIYDCCYCASAQFILENIFVLRVKEVVTSRIFRLLITLYRGCTVMQYEVIKYNALNYKRVC